LTSTQADPNWSRLYPVMGERPFTSKAASAARADPGFGAGALLGVEGIVGVTVVGAVAPGSGGAVLEYELVGTWALAVVPFWADKAFTGVFGPSPVQAITTTKVMKPAQASPAAALTFRATYLALTGFVHLADAYGR
jgi:hypothetical protein